MLLDNELSLLDLFDFETDDDLDLSDLFEFDEVDKKKKNRSC